MASRPTVRPISPHIGIYRWGPHMLVSILHRATGSGMATVGAVLLVWWLAALAAGGDAYGRFVGLFTTSAGRLNILGYVIGIGLTLSLFQHMMGGIRHLVMDTGAGFELGRNKTMALLSMIAALTLTLLFWLMVEFN